MDGRRQNGYNFNSADGHVQHGSDHALTGQRQRRNSPLFVHTGVQNLRTTASIGGRSYQRQPDNDRIESGDDVSEDYSSCDDDSFDDDDDDGNMDDYFQTTRATNRIGTINAAPRDYREASSSNGTLNASTKKSAIKQTRAVSATKKTGTPSKRGKSLYDY
jgi:hypothetical protein